MSARRKSKVALKTVLKNKNEEILRTCTVTAQRYITHSSFPAFNVCQNPLLSIDEIEEYPSCSLTPPGVAYVAPYQSPANDICYKRPLQAERHKRRLFVARSRHQLILKRKSSKLTAKAQTEGYYHSGVFDIAERLHSRPDPFFYSNYDYYYTDGNLCVFPETELVVHAMGPELNILNVSNFGDSEEPGKSILKSTVSFEAENGSEIFCMKTLKNINAHVSNCFAMRQLKKIHIMHKVDDSIVQLMEFNNKATPYISFAQSNVDETDFIVTTMKQHLRQYDLNVGPMKLKTMWQLEEEDNINNWNTIIPWREHTYLYANIKKLLIMDTRTKQSDWSRACTIPPDDYDCEIISVIKGSEFKNLVYVGTQHKLHCLDVRYMGKHLEYGNGAVCRWTHQMDCAPAFIDTHRVGVSEYIALSSAVPNDLRIFELKRQLIENPDEKIYKFCSYSMPWQPPTLQEAYESARLAGKCLMPTENIKHRINFCTTGLSFFTNINSNDPKTQLFLTNSCGDMYTYNVDWSDTRTYERSTPDGIRKIGRYAKKVARIPQPPLKYTDIVDASELKKILRCERLDQNSDDEIFEPERPKRFGRWQKSIKQLKSYKDLLAKEILQIWDLDGVEEDRLKLSQIDGLNTSDKQTYVESWLQKFDRKTEKNSTPTKSVIKDTTMEFQASETFNENAETVLQSTQKTNDTLLEENSPIPAEEVTGDIRFDDSLPIEFPQAGSNDDEAMEISVIPPSQLSDLCQSQEKNHETQITEKRKRESTPPAKPFEVIKKRKKNSKKQNSKYVKGF